MKFGNIRLLIAAAALLVTLQTLNADAQRNVREERDLPVREETSHRYQLSSGARIEVSFILGPVEIEATDSDVAEVHIVRSANARADLERFDKIDIEQTPARLALRGEDSESGGIEVHHRVKLRLPRQCHLDIREVNGRVSVSGIEGAIRLNQVNGGAMIPQLSGDLEMEGVNGGIRLGIARLTERGIRIRNVNGPLELRVAAELNASLEIGELDDHPLVETPRVTVNKVGEKKFRGRIGAGGPVIQIIDVHGRIRIRNA